MTKEQIDQMVNAFLCWKIPQTFNPDCYISFAPKSDFRGNPPTWPVGTNLFSYTEAKAMVEHMVAALTPQPPADAVALFRDLSQCVRDCGGDDPDSMEVRNRGESAITSLRAQLAERDKRVSALEAALKDADGWLPIALCPTDGVWRLVKLSDGNEAVAAFDGVGLLSKKRWQTKVFLTHRPACPSPINDLVTQPARDVFLIADLENGVYPTHFRPNDTVFGLPALNGAAT